METLGRTPFQGVTNIVRFNWHFYALAGLSVVILLLVFVLAPAPFGALALLAVAAILVPTLISLGVSYYVYDYSPLYALDWLEALAIPENGHLLTIHAGFDETSGLLARRFPQATLRVYDFYDPTKHTEISIERARNAYPAYPGTEAITTAHIPTPDGWADVVFLILAAHEIRDETERILFFNEVRRTLKPDGRVLVVEQLRDLPNFGAYTVGFLHFHAKKTWLRTFNRARLSVKSAQKLTPFISVFVLQNDGITP
ncbi:methyltransferase domain-containing protein [Fibrella sp. HMF5335]|uniref:Methyltransferase domain-containing protein n=1 Tax=Fibrella rubiginis TaxID=2817060 RepID=A0A939K715_9BACT|nr:class I SAM-dependent methyltransferase [Fibrella rubiginis]MBO0939458.1 methyltransferase domain-containing protein [Fibrella rubiginis]